MKFSVRIPGLVLGPNRTDDWTADVTADEMLGVARRADELGYDYLRFWSTS